MADKLTTLLLDALGRAVQSPAGLPLFGTKAVPGLFPAGAAAKQAAQRARDDGLIAAAGPAPDGKPDRVPFAATAKGRAWLLDQTSPRQVLEDVARAVERRHEQLDGLIAAARSVQAELAALKALVAGVLPRLADLPAADWRADLRQHLAQWHAGGAPGDCPLPDLYRRLGAAHPGLTVGQFHDGLRELHDAAELYLHPWTGPLYVLPEPAFALLVGHEVAYYASLRSGSTSRAFEVVHESAFA